MLSNYGEVFGELERLRAAVRKHRDYRGDDRCWGCTPLAEFCIALRRQAPAREIAVELANCERFIKCRRNPATEYVSPNVEIESLRDEVARLKGIIDKERALMDAGHKTSDEKDTEIARLRRTLNRLGQRFEKSEAACKLWQERFFESAKANAEIGIALVDAMVKAKMVESPAEQIRGAAEERRQPENLEQYLRKCGWGEADKIAEAYKGAGLPAAVGYGKAMNDEKHDYESELRTDIMQWEVLSK